MTFAEYQAIDAVNWSTLSAMARSPKHYQHAVENPREATDAMRVGIAAHLAILEPTSIEGRVVTWTGGRRYGKAWDEFVAEHQGAEILTLAQRDQVAGMAAAVLTHPIASHYLGLLGPTEHAITWLDEQTNVACKARLDKLILPSGRLLEVKTTASVDHWAFAGRAARLLYHGQIAYYNDGAGCQEPPIIIAVEQAPPHDVVVYDAEALLEPGRALYRRLLEKLVACLERDEWPGVADGVVPLELPRWADEESEDADWSGVEMRESAEE